MFVLLALLGTTLVHAGGPPYFVTKASDSGEVGTFRHALESGATLIKFQGVGDISIGSTLVYESEDPLTIQGSGQTIIATDDFTLFSVRNGADLSISKLSFQGVGGFSKSIPGTGKGIFVDVPIVRTGTVHVDLTDVSVSEVAYHGIHVSDCTLVGDTCGNGNGGEGDGSTASVDMSLKRVTVYRAGYGKFDGDGVRVDERGEGDIVFDVKDSSFVQAGADGIELDEGGPGDVHVTMSSTLLEENGGYCLTEPPIVCPDPDGTEECCDDDEVDLDDGFDIDEAGEGSLFATIRNSDAIRNEDEGFDFDEEGAGDIVATFTSVTADGNKDEGIKCSEENEGNVDVKLFSCTVINTRDNDGIELESEDEGGSL